MYCHIQCSKQRNDPNKSENENLGERKHYAVQIERHWFAVSHCIATEWQQETWSSITFLNKNAKCTLVQALRLCTGRTAHRGSRGTVLLFLDHGTRRGWGVSVTPRPLFTPKEKPGTHCTGGWGGTRAGLDRCGKSRPRRNSIPDLPTRSQSLYRPSYPAHTLNRPHFITSLCILSVICDHTQLILVRKCRALLSQLGC